MSPVTLPVPEDAVAVRTALESGEYDLSFALYLADEPLANEIMAAQWGNDTSGPSISADVTLAEQVPMSLEGAPVRFSVAIDGKSVPQIVGRQSFGQTAAGSSASASATNTLERRFVTDLIFATNGIHWSETTLDAYTEYPGWTPEDVLRDAISRIPYRNTVITPVGIPLLYYTRDRNDSGFKPEQTVNDIVSAVAPQTNWVLRDTPDGFVAAPDVELGRDASTDKVFDSNDIVDWRRPPRTQMRYSDVVVYRTNPDGSDAYRETAPVTYRGQLPPPAHNAFYVSMTDDSANGPSNAAQLAYNLSRRFSRGVYGDQITLPYFDPMVARQDAFRVNDLDRDSEGLWQRAWLCWIDVFQHNWQTGSGTSNWPLSTVVNYTSTILEEDRLQVPAMIVPGVSGGVLSTPIMLFGEDFIGFWFDPGYTHDAQGDPYIALDTLGAWIDPALAVSESDAALEYAGYLLRGFWFDSDNAVDINGAPWVGLDALAGGWVDPALSIEAGYDASGFFFDLDGPVGGPQDNPGFFFEMELTDDPSQPAFNLPYAVVDEGVIVDLGATVD